MADVNKITVSIDGEEYGLKKATQEAKKDIDSVSSSAISLGKIAMGNVLGNAITAAFGKIKQVVDESKQAFMDASSSMTKLATVMTQRGATQEQYDEIIKLTDAEEKLGVVSNDAMLNGLQELSTYVAKADSLKKLTNTMNNLIVQQHGYNGTADHALQTATMMGKVLQGQTGGMERIGYHLSEAEKAVFQFGTEEERVALLTEIVNDNLGDMNHALGQTDAGKQIQLANTWSQLKAQIGELAAAVGNVLIPIFSVIANVVGRAIAYVKAFFALFGVKTSGGAAATAGSVSDAADAVGDYGNAASGAAKQAKKALAAFDEMNVLTEKTSSGAGGGGGGLDILDGIEASAEAINWKSLIPDIDLPDWVNKIANLFKEIDGSKLQKSWEKLWTAIRKVMQSVLKIGQSFITDFIYPVTKFATENLLPRVFEATAEAIQMIDLANIENAFSHIFTAAARFGQTLMEIFAGVYERIAPIVGWIANFVVPPALEAIGVVINAIAATIGGLWDAISAFYDATIKPILDGIAAALEPILSLLDEAFGSVNENASLWDGFRNIISSVASAIMTLLKPAFDLIGWVVENVLKPALGWLYSILEGILMTFGLVKPKADEYKNSQTLLEEATRGAAEASERQEQALQAVSNAQLSATNAELRLLELTEEAQKKRAKYNEMLNKGTFSQEDLTKAELEAQIAEQRLEAQMYTLEESVKNVTEEQKAYNQECVNEIQNSQKAEMARMQAEGDYMGMLIALQDLTHGAQDFQLESGKMYTLTKEEGAIMAQTLMEEFDKSSKGFHNMIQDYQDAGNDIRGFFQRVKTDAQEALAATVSSGNAFDDGIAKGIIQNAWIVRNAAAWLAQQGKDAFDYVLRIQSPSKVMAEDGGFFVKGVERGIAAEAPTLIKATEEMGTAMVDAFNSAPKFQDLGTLDIADKFGELTARAQGTLELQNEATNGAIDQLAQAISNLADQNQEIVVKIGEETIIEKVVDGINNASRMRNQTVLQL